MQSLNFNGKSYFSELIITKMEFSTLKSLKIELHPIVTNLS